MLAGSEQIPVGVRPSVAGYIKYFLFKYLINKGMARLDVAFGIDMLWVLFVRLDTKLKCNGFP
jgi:hypothetical protein